ncbi:MAG: hypothetical protein MI924_31985 [Chloroflexales bacterium]|nr:hypothetical protein [Chloroflexales bacterium]
MLLRDEHGSVHVEYALLCTIVTAVIVKGIWGAYYGEPGQQVKATIQRSVFEYANGGEYE